MKQLTFLLLSLIVFSSCRKNFAYFQKSKNLTYLQKKNIIHPVIELSATEPILMASIDNSTVFIEKTESFSPKTIKIEAKNTLWDDGIKKRKKKSNVSKGTFIEKLFPNQTHKNKKISRKRRNPVPLTSTIYIGFIILGIAIVLALVSLNSLSLLFGLASIGFLYLGFKTYFRKKRRRDIFR
jgi:hypothetical protein